MIVHFKSNFTVRESKFMSSNLNLESLLNTDKFNLSIKKSISVKSFSPDFFIGQILGMLKAVLIVLWFMPIYYKNLLLLVTVVLCNKFSSYYKNIKKNCWSVIIKILI